MSKADPMRLSPVRAMTLLAAGLLALAAGCITPAVAQPASKNPPVANPPAATPPAASSPAASSPAAGAPKAAEAAAVAPGIGEVPAGSWASRCVAETRGGPFDCVIEQSAFIANTGQVLGGIAVRLAPGAQQPVLTVQVPVGLDIASGIALQVDNAKAETLAVQTCELKGCFATLPLTAERLAALKAGKTLNVGFQNLSKQVFTLPFVLTSFAEAYKKIQ